MDALNGNTGDSQEIRSRMKHDIGKANAKEDTIRHATVCAEKRSSFIVVILCWIFLAQSFCFSTNNEIKERPFFSSHFTHRFTFFRVARVWAGALCTLY